MSNPAGALLAAMSEPISRDSRPRLAPKVRLRYDRKDDRYMLLYPEMGLVLNPTAAEVVKLCTGEHTVGAIVDDLSARFNHEASTVEREVQALLTSLSDRGLVHT
jgi:coenzyme PQQ biosynthesis protein PqqD